MPFDEELDDTEDEVKDDTGPAMGLEDDEDEAEDDELGDHGFHEDEEDESF